MDLVGEVQLLQLTVLISPLSHTKAYGAFEIAIEMTEVVHCSLKISLWYIRGSNWSGWSNPPLFEKLFGRNRHENNRQISILIVKISTIKIIQLDYFNFTGTVVILFPSPNGISRRGA